MKRWLAAAAAVLVVFLALVVGSALLPDSPDRLPGSVTNPRPGGVRALGEVLGRNGVAVTQVTTLAEAATAASGSTLAIYLNSPLSTDALRTLRDAAADLVVLYAGDGSGLDILTDGRVTATYWWQDEEVAEADCSDPDAAAAGTLTGSEYGLLVTGGGVTSCFRGEDEAALYATGTIGRHRVTVVGGNDWLHNDTITDNGNAALALRVLGRHPRLTWYLPGADARATTAATGGTDLWQLLPPWSRAVLALLVAAAAAAALWRGRRFGALVPEALPVAVPAAEASSGLGRLYRQGGARGHAAAALRAATIDRLAARLGLSATATPDVVVDRLAAASGRPPAELRALCYGPAPANDSELVALATDLNDLEGKLSNRD